MRPLSPTMPLTVLDAGLTEGLDADRRSRATLELVAAVHRVRRGSWTPANEPWWPCDGALLVVDGCVVREVRLEHRAGAEILGPGDVLRPWEEQPEHTVYACDARYEVVEMLTLACLDRALLARLGSYPEVTAALLERSLERARRATEHLVLAQLAAVEHRLHLALWYLADRWGRVGVDGVRIPLALTHRQLGLLIGARRPSVTAAMGRLVDAGHVAPAPGEGYMLIGEPPHDLPLARRVGPPRASPVPQP